ncbi:tRNA (N(6)-L-threonylcarbamoyladenosine(37)-C(2))-methylthiotransferase MtaB [Pacificimonas flava]|uniref:tRNA (N(6)-L-threonylcarbamoyladenosine(37)-C(2))-methylthiotransferase MtaB n=2 Tax=Pacificimonas TaxID=1960290 RepID=A0A219B8U7_9SPHN|nr:MULTISPECIES: tRNA (N(6)-L-threonylcarbamoyladenosine(37)-C(2))-methylthiotransferase MtaB [Pacificimonas]MBZ6380067.1 tRNA (N(6)-L-threonylcarbamoyladenosine(37)-C(2))-methylthiotransferase MtaB [Pacificimonas aurantium]OWV34546.1 tRNA (N(6)-L-threonylcarbamoyladenosine(37)-C(2))-methylthiotransferase MtaB [Pacificimonas flava]
MGCRLNIHEGEIMRAHLNAARSNREQVVVNSCAVTNEAVRQTRQTVRRLRRERPDAEITVTGCAAQIDPDMFRAMAEVDRVLGNAEKLKPESWTETGTRVGDIMRVRETAPHIAPAMEARVRGFVEVQNGCDHRCTFCIIPYGRGNARSVPAGLVIDRVRALVEAGHPEVVLTGVDLTSYGPDLPGAPTLGSLVGRILKHVPELPRLRLSSIDSIEADEELIELISGEPRVMPHLHLSLQAGDDMILKRMKRRHSRADAIRFVERVKAARPEIAIGADLIAGFPTETEDMHENSLRLLDECDVVFGHIFPFSPREGTPAARMPQLPGEIRKTRAKALRDRAATRRNAWYDALKGTRHSLLAERGGKGHLDSFAPVRLWDGAVPGEMITAHVTGHEAGTLIAEPA